MLKIELEANRSQFRPGETIHGQVWWRGPHPLSGVQMRLSWQTRGKGDIDHQTVYQYHLGGISPDGRKPFRFKLPDQPYSFSGKLISLIWQIEATPVPSGEGDTVEITMSPNGREILLGSVPAKKKLFP